MENKFEITVNVKVTIEVDSEILGRIFETSKPSSFSLLDMMHIANIPYRELTDKSIFEKGGFDYRINNIKSISV